MNRFEMRDYLTLTAVILLFVNIFLVSAGHVKADTFRLDDCITANPGDKPAAYLHVVTH